MIRALAISTGAVFISLLLFSGCTPGGESTTVKGKIAQADNLQVYLDRVVIGKPGNELDRSSAGSGGSYSFQLPRILDPGVYQLRVGTYKLPLLLEEGDQHVTLDTDLASINDSEVAVTGSPGTRSYYRFLRENENPFPDDVRNFVDTSSHPYAAAWLTFSLWRNRTDLLDLHESAWKKLEAGYPDSEMAGQYKAFIQAREKEYAKITAEQRIQVGNPAPNIVLPSPSGKEMALHDLKGQIVLLDFWASWCGPCRRENPNVVKVYEKYKDKGFNIFSVSLDGLDSRAKARLGRADQIAKMEQQQRDKWLAAIRQDNLSWENHVSDLKGWESDAAALYGVSAIPQTYLIDRDGNIAVMSIRGAAMLERELKKLL